MDIETPLRLLVASDTAVIVRTAASVLIIVWGSTRIWAVVVRTMDGAQTTVVSNAGKLVKLQQAEIARLTATCERLDAEVATLRRDYRTMRARVHVANKTI